MSPDSYSKSPNPSGEIDRSVGAKQVQSEKAPDTTGRLNAIEVEGGRALQLRARKLAWAIFKDPSSVTTRRIGRLGEEGLAAFVTEMRKIAEAYILRERDQKQRADSDNGVGAPNTAEVVDEKPPAISYRNPQAFGEAIPKAAPVSSIRLTYSALLRGAFQATRYVLIWGFICAETIVTCLYIYQLYWMSIK